MRPLVEPLIPAIVSGFHQAFSLAIGSSLWIGFGAALIAALVTAVLLPELPLRDFRAARQQVPGDEASVLAPFVE